ncbi:hydroxyquinol 1,2-dioxygenase [Pseudomonas sp. BN505]|uniref:dioxygenase family protein n=1 Tax=unclassified Pseudomonas TaxID=196821 RepID=UPI0024546482|nr:MULTISPECIES: dioxygenase [unclassified Pseudomonas]MDH4842227.1 hydroxyquinol 1,2-dioxygenase [Pseudomonas sp. BN605]MDH4855082.1 hydroxyquinol 1,2-dioxygenase [Pseudomonas sp. BN505]
MTATSDNERLVELTNAVIAQMSGTPSTRLREVMECAVRHLHAFAIDTGLTPEEWLAGVAFLTATGQMSSAHRKEFILLSDALGLSAVVNLLQDGMGLLQATESSLLGPFYREQAPLYQNGQSMAVRCTGPQLQLKGRILDCGGNPIPEATVQIWQTDSEGVYDIQRGLEMDVRGVYTTDENGRYHALTVMPKSYPLPDDGPVRRMLNAQGRHGCRPAHIHFLISAPGHKELVTALYIAGDRFVNDDTVFGVTSEQLIVTPTLSGEPPTPEVSTISYDFHLAAGEDTGGRVGADVSSLNY